MPAPTMTVSQARFCAKDGASALTGARIHMDLVCSLLAFMAERPTSSGSFQIDLLLGDARQLSVGRFLLIEGGRQQFCDSLLVELFRPGDERAVTRDLVVLDRLRGGDQGRVEHL